MHRPNIMIMKINRLEHHKVEREHWWAQSSQRGWLAKEKKLKQTPLHPKDHGLRSADIGSILSSPNVKKEP